MFFVFVDRDRAIGAKNAEILKYAKQDQILKTIDIQVLYYKQAWELT